MITYIDTHRQPKRLTNPNPNLSLTFGLAGLRNGGLSEWQAATDQKRCRSVCRRLDFQARSTSSHVDYV